MDLEFIFSIAGMLAIGGWLSLLLSPWLPGLANVLAGWVAPLLLAIAYGALILVFWGDAAGGFDSLENVKLLFEHDGLVLAGWLHYLAFDLLTGRWEVQTARALGIPFVLLVPCLLLTFLFGPIGFLLFSILVAIRKLRSPVLQSA